MLIFLAQIIVRFSAIGEWILRSTTIRLRSPHMFVLQGVITTYTLKVVILLFLRSTFFKAFYRVRPAASNIMGVILECWNLGLSPGFMIARALQLLGLAVIYIGRLDTDFLAKGVGVFGPVVFDSYPMIFRKDLLVHEAHRHPYIERLGVMYMLKLRYGSAFMNRAGTSWRILFVLALM